ncbi:uncharacterized protein LOC113753447 [Coffea eugenioides]|uniref:uncharacterized protein LOC113753447 n=1 Tax=Coffea eugenioides TaxID=49369 RepID=UPI000F60C919|nr:uncharacterized protein LOC113753447 [Coffea eugenioides]
MATPEETSRLRTLADAVSEPALSAAVGSGLAGPDKNRALSRGIPGGFDVNKVSEEAEEEEMEDSVVAVTKRTEISLVETRMTLGTGLEGTEKLGHGVALGLGSSDGKIGPANGSASVLAKSGIIEDLNADNGGNAIVKMDGETGAGDDADSIDGHGYSVGDLVWGKIKSHPWWPGQIYDPKHASDYALKFSHTGRLLVAYFGDGSFAWCQPSQLIPFAEHFEDMCKQSNSKSFVTAVQEAVDEIGRLVELEMICKCVPEENRKGLHSPLAANAGIKAGVLVPEGGIGKLLSFRYDSAELLATVQSIAESVSFAGVLELAILKSWLSAFYRARGGYWLPVYYEGLQIEGLEGNNRTAVEDKNDSIVPIEVPVQGPHEKDWSLALAGPGNGPAPSDDQNHHGRKQKSVAEIMAEGTDKKSKSRKRSIVTQGTNASSSAKQKRKDDEDGNQNGSVQSSGTVRKRSRKKISSAENGHVQPQEEIHKNSLSIKLNEDEIAVADDNDGEGAKGTEEISSPRERKKSKYLSPPYTNSRFRSGNPIFKNELQKESEKISKIARMGERMTKAAGILLEPPPLVKCNAQTVEEKLPSNGKQGQQKIIDSADVNAPVKEVLAGIKSGAVNHLHSSDGEFPDFIRGFISAFRSSVRSSQSNYTPKRLPGRKRKSVSSEQGDLGNLDVKSAEAKYPRTIDKRSARDKSDKPKLKKNARPKDKQVDGKSPPESLVVTFAPGFSLPSKDDVIRIFSKFGVLNEKETVVFPESASVQIVYSSPGGAEEALRESLKQSPFGSRSVNYKVRHSSASSMAVESSHNTSSDNPVASWPAAGEKSQLVSIRQKLEIMTSMLEKCDGKISTEEVYHLDAEIKPLLEKVRKMAGDVSQ